jgi:transcriptional regulator with XRE-family HTH domain
MTTPANPELTDYLQVIWLAAGRPSSRSLAERCGISHTTINDILRGHRMGGWPTLSTLVRLLGGDVREVEAILGADSKLETKDRTPGQLTVLREILEELRSIRKLLERDGA